MNLVYIKKWSTMKEIISLIGFMGTGKSAIGRNVAKQLNYKFIDTDRYIEKKVGMSVLNYFAQFGEEEFRRLENQYLKEILAKYQEPLVLSTGGGIILDEENRELLKKHSYVISLKVSPKTIYYRTRRKRRPLLQTRRPLKTIHQLLKKRKGLYDFGDVILYTDHYSIRELSRKVIHRYKEQSRH